MKTSVTIIIIVTSLCLPISSFGESAMDRAVEKKYGELAVEKMKALQYPGKLYPGISQDRNEANDDAAQITQQAAIEGIEQERGKQNLEIMESAVDSYKNGMKDWAEKNSGMEALEPLKSIGER